MEKIKVICVKNVIREHPFDDYTELPFTIGKVYEVSVPTDGSGWCWVTHDSERWGHYPMKLFKPLNQHRDELINDIFYS